MESCIIKLTEAAHKHGNLNIRPCGKDFFPKDAFGGSSRKTGLGRQITLQVEGLENPIKTDIPTDKNTKRPRWIFRERAWAKKFIRVNNLKAGDTIVVNRVAPRKYIIAPNGKDTYQVKNLLSPIPGDSDLVTIEQAATLVGKTIHNIRDYIQRGRIKKYNALGKRITKASNGQLRISLKELKKFLYLVERDRQRHHNSDLHEELGFYDLPEYERTKHVHRLHPYLGKFIPQPVEWFLKKHFDENDIVLDPFMGSGTTLVQGNEMGMHTIGIDVS